MTLRLALACMGLHQIAQYMGTPSVTTLVQRWLTLLTLWSATGGSLYLLAVRM